MSDRTSKAPLGLYRYAWAGSVWKIVRWPFLVLACLGFFCVPAAIGGFAYSLTGVVGLEPGDLAYWGAAALLQALVVLLLWMTLRVNRSSLRNGVVDVEMALAFSGSVLSFFTTAYLFIGPILYDNPK